MTVSCKLTPAEMREAFRMNLTPAFWWKSALGNLRALAYLIVILVAVGIQLVHKGPIEWGVVGVALGVTIFLFGLYLLRLNGSIKKSAKQISETCSQMTVDGQGITAESPNGSKTFVPWAALSRWREGKLVFTVGDGKTYRTMSKGALGEMQSGELRSILMTSICQQQR